MDKVQGGHVVRQPADTSVPRVAYVQPSAPPFHFFVVVQSGRNQESPHVNRPVMYVNRVV